MPVPSAVKALFFPWSSRKNSGDPTSQFRFTDAAREVLEFSREESAKRRHGYVGTEHILLGLLASKSPGLQSLTERLGLDRSAVVAHLDTIMKKGNESTPSIDLPYTSRAKKVLELAMLSAAAWGTKEVGPEQLLAGVCAEERGLGAQALVEFGVTETTLRQAMKDPE